MMKIIIILTFYMFMMIISTTASNITTIFFPMLKRYKILWLTGKLVACCMKISTPLRNSRVTDPSSPRCMYIHFRIL
ncbi:unnamed protein product [Cochlearia groenlandica]